MVFSIEKCKYYDRELNVQNITYRQFVQTLESLEAIDTLYCVSVLLNS